MSTDTENDDNASIPTKRATLRMTEEDFVRLRVLLAQEQLTWQGVLSQALNAWLKKQGHDKLEDIR